MPPEQHGSAYKLGPGRWGIRWYDRCGVRRRKSGFGSRSEALAYYRDVLRPEILGLAVAQPDITLDELCELFLERYPGHEDPLIFFESFARAVGVDVFATPFPRQAGYAVYRSGGVTVLLLRLEDLDRCAREAFQQVFGLETFALVDENVASEKAYRDMYRRVRQQLRLPESYLQKMYESRYATHFYSADEVQQFRARWARG